MSDETIDEHEFDASNVETQEEFLQEPLKVLKSAWLNEKFAPELLPHKENLVRFMMQCLSDMEEKLESLDKDDIRITIHTMELNRIRFLISSYLRTRLRKIENHVIHILKEHSNLIASNSENFCLTESELNFAKDYFRNFETLFQTVALQHMPDKFRAFDYDTLSVNPNLQSQVFLTANKEIDGIIIPETMEDPITFEAGSQHIVQYGVISKFVKSGDVQLL
ncbi:DNA replication complex GINS protein SLD5 [Leptopilina heterotoma]|uniref:DNA replication complex GINS protein SLD5 n=1 Tax=Leptopilina heterotoma TaxID=63436 RepID=UPI001CA824AD|nr:DNA replication complex GINS protein SLD5 [Leptopilina heterotoma]